MPSQPHRPLLQLCPLAQVTPQPPQLPGSERRSLQRWVPPSALLPQHTAFAPQARAQLPATQRLLLQGSPAPQLVAQVPQWSGSERTSTQPLPHSVRPKVSQGWQVLPPQKRLPAAQTWLQSPQLSGSASRSRQVPPQSV